MSEGYHPYDVTGLVYWGPGVYLKDEDVNLTQIDQRIINFLDRLGNVHPFLFGIPVVVTSGRDSLHVASSKHGTGQAVDIRIVDKKLEHRAAFLLVCDVLTDQYGLTLFDESNSPSAPHLHVEVAS